jgi:hypothetical protein
MLSKLCNLKTPPFIIFSIDDYCIYYVYTNVEALGFSRILKHQDLRKLKHNYVIRLPMSLQETITSFKNALQQHVQHFNLAACEKYFT